MTLRPTALPRPAQAMAAPQAGNGLAISLLLHALGVAGLIAASLSAPRATRPAPVIELLAVPRPAPNPPAPVPPPIVPAPAPARSRAPSLPSAPLPQPAPPPPAIVRDESALARADTLAAPTADIPVTNALPSLAPNADAQGIPGGTAPPGPPGGTAGPLGGPGLKGKLVSVTRLTRMPILTLASKPEYTAEMKRHNLAGKLKAKVLVDSDGKVKDAVVLTDLGFGTRETGLAALRKLEFDPGYADGAAVAVWIPFTFTFEWQE